MKEKRNNSAGVGIGLLVCGLILLAFPGFAGLSGLVMWIFYGVGLLVLLVGVLGTCMDMFGGSKE